MTRLERWTALSAVGACLFAAAPRDSHAQLLNPSFESGLSGWEKTGTAFDRQPTYSENVVGARVRPVSLGGDYWADLPIPIGVRGRYWIGTRELRPTSLNTFGSTQRDDSATGTLTSKKFKLPKGTSFVSFLISGGSDPARLKVELLEARGDARLAVKGIAAKTGHGKELFRRDWWDVRALDRKLDYAIRVTDEASGAGGHINVDDFRMEPSDPRTTVVDGRPALLETVLGEKPRRVIWTDYDAPLWGAADLHTHPMSHLAMGGKLMHGAPDVGSLLPAGTRRCNPRERRATSVAEALGSCASTHGGWGTDNTCGNHLRAFAINVGFDSDYVHRFGGCPDGMEKSHSLCYPKCTRPGFHGGHWAGPACYADCPAAGFHDSGGHCDKRSQHERKTYLAWQHDHCHNENAQGCDKGGALGEYWYPRCKPGFKGVLNWCWPLCPPNTTDTGAGCLKHSYARGAGIVPPSTNLHGDHPHAGFPNFLHWPHWSSKSHQQMYVEWIRRAHQGGLRVLVALAVNNELLGEALSGDAPKDDKASGDRQLDEIRSFVGRHGDFMKEVQTAAELRKAVKNGKLAVIVGVELDNIGNFNYGNPTLRGDPAAVKREIRRLFTEKGVRYVFPLHFADNVFGGPAVKGPLFNLSNRFARTRPLPIGSPFPPGFLFRVRSGDPTIDYRMSLLGSDGEWAHGLTLTTAKVVLDAVGMMPFPPAFDALKCPSATLGCLPQFSLISSLLSPDPQWDMYTRVPGGHVNVRGLTPVGKLAIQEMMRLGMFIDIDHMSELAATQTLALARELDYPVNSGHTGFRPGSENTRTPAQLASLGALGGLMGVGWAGGTSNAASFVLNYRKGVNHRERRDRNGRLVRWAEADLDNLRRRHPGKGGPMFSLGSDINGFETMPHPRHDPKHPLARPAEIPLRAWNKKVCYAGRGCSDNAALRQCTFGSTRTWDYNVDGVAHIGLYPDIYQDMKNLGMTLEERSEFFTAADALARMWDKIELRRSTIR